MVFPLPWPGADAALGCNRHHRLSNGLLPALAHVPPHTRCCQHGVVIQAAIVLPDVVHHVGCDHLEAVRVAALRQAAEVLCRLHLQDLGQRDFLQFVKTDSVTGRMQDSK